MKTKALFPTLIGSGTLQGAKELNRDLLKDIELLSHQDKMGIEWSRKNYKGGYTSYASLNDVHHRTPALKEFATRLQPHAEEFSKKQGWPLRGLKLEMTSCWINVMSKNTYHTLHLHPHSAISGVYYVQIPKGSVSLKIEDPRMAFYMSAPVRNENSAPGPLYHKVIPSEGEFILFESWLRHEVPPNQSEKSRISISFNYAFEDDV